jgi:predicted ATPase
MHYRVENFKSLKNTGDIEITPLTIFIGPNGTGKSSAIQPLLFLSQTMTNCRNDIGFLPNGEYIKIGNYYDFVNEHDISAKLKIFMDFGDICLECEKNCSKDGRIKQIEGSNIGDIPPAKYEMIFRCGKDNQPELEKIIILDCLNRTLLSREKNGDNYYSLDFYKTVDKTDEFIYDLIVKQMPDNFIFNERDILDSIYQKNREKYYKTNEIKLEKSISRYFDVISFNNKNIVRKLSRIKYVGPIREGAKRYYEYNKENYREVGRFGEACAYILFQYNNEITKKQELLKWLGIFGLADDFKIKLIPDHPELFALEFKEKDKDYYINYADACFGLSQLLPLLVQSVYSSEDDLIIIEQPELHLNPCLESLLADFFVDMIDNKKCLIIETHSEYLLLRLRTYIKRGRISNKQTALYFTENNEGSSTIRKINIDENGCFPDNDWPKGFFGEALAENLMFATAVKQ